MKCSALFRWRRYRRRRGLHGWLLTGALGLGLTVLCMCGGFLTDNPTEIWRARRLLQLEENYTSAASTAAPTTAPVDPCADPPNNMYPTDIFDVCQRRQGAVILHVVGMIYMFVALAVVCDEFFVPALSVIIDKLQISEDVAGATFMAAGGSAPELCASVIGTFISRSDVGIGTIVGSAVFNILFVIAMCAIFSKTVLVLTWWPLFRDMAFYVISLLALILCFRDRKIEWYEALVLITCYAAYVIFMKFNARVEKSVKSLLNRKKKRTVQKANSQDSLMVPPKEPRCRNKSIAMLRSAGYRHGMISLLIHNIHPMAEDGSEHVQLENVTTSPGHGEENGRADVRQLYPTIYEEDEGKQREALLCSGAEAEKSPSVSSYAPITAISEIVPDDETVKKPTPNEPDMDEDEEPMDLSWPPTLQKRITYVLMAPIVFPLWITLPDVRKPTARRFFPWGFLGSIIWISFFSYLMVWWARQVGYTAYIPEEVMGLTFLAAGTSIPDLITSVIVAKKGFGDMAVSSSVGSNIFDVTVGLPVPWLLYTAIYWTSVEVKSKGLLCSVLLLFGMLLMVIITIAASRWRMSWKLGAAMLIGYVIFVTFSLLLEFSVLNCPDVA